MFARLLGSLVVLAGLYLGVCWYAGRSIPPGSQVAGVSVGGLTEDEAAARVDSHLDRIRRTPVKVSWPGGEKRVEPAALGLGVDPRASVAGLTGFSLDPRRVWDRLSNGVQRQGAVALDAGTADRTLGSWAAELERPATEGTVTFDGGQVNATPPRDGRRLDVPATRGALAASWPAGTDVTAVLVTTPPAIPRDRFDAAVETVARPAVSAPLKVRSGQAEATLQPRQYAPGLRMEADGGNLVLRVDEQRFIDAAQQVMPNLEANAKNATVRITPGQPPRVQPAENGWHVQRGEVGDVVRAALTAPDRTAALPVETVMPILTTEQVTAWGITAPLAQADLPRGEDPDQQAALTALTRPLDGVLLAPNDSHPWPMPQDAAGEGAAIDGSAVIEAVRRAATSAGLTVTEGQDGTLTLINPTPAGVLLQVDRSADPARFVVWGRANAV